MASSVVAATPHVYPLMLDHEIAMGSEGSVVLGSYFGRPAIIKLLGPDRRGLRIWRTEVQMLERLKVLQGEWVPELLGSGHLEAGVHFIALSKVDGESLSKLRDNSGGFPPGVGESAKAGLKRLREVVPGFLHGDIRLENVMWGVQGSANNRASSSCVFIDFGRSRADGSIVQQAQEELHLCSLLGCSSSFAPEDLMDPDPVD